MSETVQDAYQAMLIEIVNQGGPAFPSDMNGMSFVGMTLRDWFAGQVIAAIHTQVMSLHSSPYFENKTAEEMINISVGSAYELADAMLAERNKK